MSARNEKHQYSSRNRAWTSRFVSFSARLTGRVLLLLPADSARKTPLPLPCLHASFTSGEFSRGDASRHVNVNFPRGGAAKPPGWTSLLIRLTISYRTLQRLSITFLYGTGRTNFSLSTSLTVEPTSHYLKRCLKATDITTYVHHLTVGISQPVWNVNNWKNSVVSTNDSFRPI